MGWVRLGQGEAAFLPGGLFWVHLGASLARIPPFLGLSTTQFPHGGGGGCPTILRPLPTLGFEGGELRGVMGEPRDLGVSLGSWGGKVDPPGSN